ncbi:HAD family hydrolase [Aureibacter tunicatorum]|uniref:P-type E1-E2 ATPase n=1 Tax=Aureibacter tunicatorum TaxID=866807 RepID=A0AAE3XPR6_9BACT|nr:HAD hydrolase family protein [Aureibacter tunicatorum]MDR6239701.1 P-type E1-E2 ATPase [Aureibacter tunicatorum]BDD04177.1 hypothetical protein AUTU_16600 [Aureibacter tunicatorum]
MLSLSIPGKGRFEIKHIVLDYNGTLAIDGAPINGVRDRLRFLAQHFEVHVLTGDYFNSVKSKLRDLPCSIEVISQSSQCEDKVKYVEKLGAESVIAIGNGYNDSMMLEKAALGIVVMQEEGCSSRALRSADILSRNIFEALQLLIRPKRLEATLRY